MAGGEKANFFLVVFRFKRKFAKLSIVNCPSPPYPYLALSIERFITKKESLKATFFLKPDESI